jgi:tetratricopeptide (TPR) repeat protein
MHKGSVDEALAEYHEAIRLNPDFADAHWQLGAVLRDKGRFAEALNSLRRGHELGAHNPGWKYLSEQGVRECERLLELDGKLPAVMSGEQKPHDAAERLDYANLCYTKRLFAAAAGFSEQALAESPELADAPNSETRYNAACSAALAGCGQGEDRDSLDEAARQRWRRQALDWLRAELAQCADALPTSQPDARSPLLNRLRNWQRDRDLAGVRDEESPAKLSDAEQQSWREFWAEVETLIEKATITGTDN